MLAVVVAAAALAAAPNPAAGGPISVVAPAADLPKFVERPSGTAFSAAYPHGAAFLGMGGRAVVHCSVSHADRLEKCQVVSETPEGAGFGGAAMNLARLYRLDPASDAVQRGEVDLPISFATALDENEIQVTGPWLSAPGFADTGAVYSDIGGGVTGQVVLHCTLERDGTLKACKTLYQHPPDREFDVGALKLTHFFRVAIDRELLRSRQPLGVNVVLRIAAPYGPEAKERRLSDPVWLARPDAASLAKLFPPQATAKGVTTGLGYADCTVAPDGALKACAPFGGDPPDLGFSEAAATAAATMRMSPWTEAGGPVDGARVRVPLRFTQAAAK